LSNRTEAASFPRYRQRCGWNALLPPRRVNAELEEDLRCDVVIVGAGYTGLAAARRFQELEPEARIVVLDASEVGEGSPGRNSGFMLEIALADDADPRQLERMTACNRLIADAMTGLKRLVDTNEIACDLSRTGTYRAAAGAAGIAALRNYRAFLDAACLPYEPLDRQQLHDRLGTRFYKEGLYSPHCYLVQPAALIRGLADSLPPRVVLHENSPVVAIERKGGTWTARTPKASVRAPLLILANNAFCKNLGIAESRIVAMYTYAAMTKPLSPGSLDSLGSDLAWGLLPAHRLGSTLRRTGDGRLLIRSLYGYEAEADSGTVSVMLKSALERRYPQLRELDFSSVWSGATGFTLNGAPVWGEYAPGLFVAAGCNGGGVVKGTLFGRLLAEVALGFGAPDIAALFGRAAWMPPDPLRRLGFNVVSRVERYKGRAEA
jgi:glycine/D-amino acid oxidase-like deaminating enzyme